MKIIYLSLLIFDILIYLLSFYLIWKRKQYQEISLRSPFLLIMNNLGGFFMTFTYLLYETFEDELNNSDLNTQKLFCEILPYNYIVFHSLMLISFYLRCHRIIISCNIADNEKKDDFITNRYLYTERYYVKVLTIVMIIILIISFFFNYVLSKKFNIIILPNHFNDCIQGEQVTKDLIHQFMVCFWIILHFIECLVLITYTYCIYYSQINKTIKFELFSFLFLWIFNSNLLRILDIYYDSEINGITHFGSFIFVIIIMLCLITNTYIPITYSYFESNNFNLHFTTKLLDNFFIFMTNDFCFKEYVMYLQSTKDAMVLQHLEFYVEVISLKLKFNLNMEFDFFLSEIKRIYYKFFINNIELFKDDIRNKTSNNFKNYDRNEVSLDLFDDALVCSYELLESKFAEYKNTESYAYLAQRVGLHSDIFCRMYNTGLIRKN